MKKVISHLLIIIFLFLVSYSILINTHTIDAKTIDDIVDTTLNLSTTSDNIVIGDYIEFGSYYNKPILWQVININSDGSYMLWSDDILCLKAFDANGDDVDFNGDGVMNTNDSQIRDYGSNYWFTSNIREWLNSEENSVTFSHNEPIQDRVFDNAYANEAGFLSDFTIDERYLISPYSHKVILSYANKAVKDGGTIGLYPQSSTSNIFPSFLTNYDIAYYKTATDKVFILDFKDLYEYVSKRGFSIIKSNTNEAANRSTYSVTGGEPWKYFTLTSDGSNGCHLRTITQYGGFSLEQANSGWAGIVPAINIKANIMIVSGDGSSYHPYNIKENIQNNPTLTPIPPLTPVPTIAPTIPITPTSEPIPTIIPTNEPTVTSTVKPTPTNIPTVIPTAIPTPTNIQNSENNSFLKALSVNVCSLEPSFEPSKTLYKAFLPNSTLDIPVVYATPDSDQAKITITQATNITGDETERTAKIQVVSMDKSSTTTYEVLFCPVSDRLNLQSDNGKISIMEGIDYNNDNAVSLIAIPDAGYKFVSWSGDISGNASTINVTVNRYMNIVANFEKCQYNLKINSEHGTVEKNLDKTLYDYGDIITLTANPDSGYIFTGWGGNVHGTDKIITVEIIRDLDIYPSFVTNQPTVFQNVFASDYNTTESISALSNWSIVNHGNSNTISSTSDGCYIVTAMNEIRYTNTLSRDGYSTFKSQYPVLRKISQEGTLIWETATTYPNLINLVDAKETHDGGIITVGVARNSSNGYPSGEKSVIIKFNKYGEELWSIDNVNGNNVDGYNLGIIVTTDNGFLFYVNHNGSSIYKYSCEGTIQWYKCFDIYHLKEFGTIDKDILYMAECNDGSFITVGTRHQFASDESIIMKFSSEGTLIWQKAYSQDEIYSFTSLEKTSDNNFIIGYYSRKGGNKLLKIDDLGNEVWHSNVIPGYIEKIREMQNGNIAIVVNSGSDAYYIMQLNPNSDLLKEINLQDYFNIQMYGISNFNITDFIPVADKTYVVVGYWLDYRLYESYNSSWEYKLYDNMVFQIDQQMIPVSSVNLAEEEIYMYENETKLITHDILPEDASCKQVLWSSSDNDIATVINGVVYSHKEGSAIITVTTVNGEKKDQCIVHVQKKIESTPTPTPTPTTIPTVTPTPTPMPIVSGNLTCDNSELLSLCNLTDDGNNYDLSIDLSDVDKKKHIFGLLLEEAIHYKIYYNEIDDKMLYQPQKDLEVNPYSNNKDLYLNESFKTNGKYIIELYAGINNNTVYVVVDVNDKSNEKNFGHVILDGNEKVAIIPYDKIIASRPTSDTVNKVNEAKYCIEHYSLQDWCNHMDQYYEYDKLFPNGSFGDYLDARLKAQTKVVGNDLVGSLRNASSMQLVNACNKLGSIVTGLDPDELAQDIEAAKIGNPGPLINTIDGFIENADSFINSKLKKYSILKVLNIFNSVFEAINSFSSSYTLSIQAEELEDLQNAFYNEADCMLRDEFSDYPSVGPGQWLELTYHDDWLNGIVITDAKVRSGNLAEGYSYASHLNFVPANEKAFNEQLKIRDLSKEIMSIYPETFIYKYITLKTIVELHCPIIVDVCKGDTVIASISNTEPTNIVNEYGFFCSYFENGELIKKVIMNDPELKLHIRGTSNGVMNMVIAKNGLNGSFELDSRIDDISISPTTNIVASDISNMNKLEVDENGDGNPDKEYTVTTIQLIPENTYTVTVGTLAGGSIIAYQSTAAAGESINLTITPDAGKRLKLGSLKYIDGMQDGAIAGTSFIMPAADVTVTAEFEDIPEFPITYTVTFKDWNGTVVKTEVVNDGAAATAPSNPSRMDYTFTGWDVTFSNVTSDLTVTAQYSQNPVTNHTVTFKDWNGTVVKTEVVNDGAAATAPSNPSRMDYTFTGWDVTFSNVTSDLTVTAQYNINGSVSGGSNSTAGNNTALPKIKGSETAGWASITISLKESKTGNIVIDMNGSTIVKKDVFEAIKGKDLEISFDLGNGIEWIINGKDILENTELQDVDFKLILNMDNIPLKLVEEISGTDKIQFSLAHDGNFDFTATLRLPLNEGNSGKRAYLFYYNPVTKQIVLQSTSIIDENGYVEFKFTHASDYVILIRDESMLQDEIKKITVTPINKILYYGGTTDNDIAMKTELPKSLQEAVCTGIYQMSNTYLSSNPKVAYVSKTGKVIAKKAGKTIITTITTVNGIERKFQTSITVKKAYIKMTMSTCSMKIEESYTFNAIGYGVETKDIIYLTTKKSIIAISKTTGKAIAVSIGTDYVIAMVGDIEIIIKVIVK